MCELLGINASRAVNAGPWLRRFQLRGGALANNRDGWGLAYTEGGEFKITKSPTPGAESSVLSALCSTVQSSLVIGHVRHANHPYVNSIENTHPFIRSCCGKEWIFAHNGLVSDIKTLPEARLHEGCNPLGQTDSEYAFCYLLERIAFHIDVNARSNGEVQVDRFASIVELVAAHGRFNFLISDGAYLIAYGHDHLHFLDDSDTATKAVVIATAPLSTDKWVPFEPGELRIYQGGRLITSRHTRLGAVHERTEIYKETTL